MRRCFRPSLVVLLLGVGTAAAADPANTDRIPDNDPITEQIDAGLRAYREGESRVAIQALQFAVAQIEEQLRAKQLTLLPEPLPGWTADTATSDSGGLAAMIAGTSLTRVYRNEETDSEITLTVTADSPLLSMMSMMMTTPMLMQASPASSAYTYSGFRGVTEKDQAGNTTKVTLMVGTRILVQLDARGEVDQQTMEAYLEALNLTGLEKALLG
jgi:hypothetical protein